MGADTSGSLVGVRLGEYLDHTNAAIPFPLSNTEESGKRDGPRKGPNKGKHSTTNGRKAQSLEDDILWGRFPVHETRKQGLVFSVKYSEYFKSHSTRPVALEVITLW
jgi:hypothetical protein